MSDKDLVNNQRINSFCCQDGAPRTQVPSDFFPTEKKSLKKRDGKDPLKSRRNWMVTCLDQRPPEEKKSPPPSIDDDKLEKKLLSFRSACRAWIKPRCVAWALGELHKKYPGKVLLDGHKVADTDEFISWMKRQVCNNDFRGIMHYFCVEVWSSNNQWAINQSLVFCEMMGIEFIPRLCDDNDETAKTRKHNENNCAHKIFVRQKGEEVTRVRDEMKKLFGEAPLHRRENLKRTTGKEHNGIPKMVHWERSTIEVWGFNGKIAFSSSHWCYIQKMKEKEKTATKTPLLPIGKSDATIVSNGSSVSTLTPHTQDHHSMAMMEFMKKKNLWADFVQATESTGKESPPQPPPAAAVQASPPLPAPTKGTPAPATNIQEASPTVTNKQTPPVPTVPGQASSICSSNESGSDDDSDDEQPISTMKTKKRKLEPYQVARPKKPKNSSPSTSPRNMLAAAKARAKMVMVNTINVPSHILLCVHTT